MKRNIVIATVAAAALIGGGTAVALADSGTGSARSSYGGAAGAAGAAQASGKVAAHPSESDDKDDADNDAKAAAKARVTLSDAAGSALKAVPGTLSSIDLDDDARTAAWDAEILGKDGTWHEVTVDASSGKVLDQHVDRGEDDDARERAALRKAEVSAVQAARKAAAGGGTATSVDIDDDHAAVWEVEVVKNHKERELTVDAQTGKVAQAPSDDDRAEAGDRDDD
ncbi:PepSY domain-containing protein [Streptomyces sp. NA02950]|uniref:PepSY domain-containing protein n=1 Tax=Streptomyces sp. NA02950 TaxID=2742137 RepID=UPI001591583A|nr:PepSY domain-containing protein [Streptomyces sp. NA02950]QKV92515.1 PepSY domain-containing protein [Streptomyces sp. NA02950]